jgi:arylsulfatase A-like enzyme
MRKTYAAMVSAVDDGVGKLLDKLDILGIEDNTIIFFLSDNGGPEATNGSDNGPLREGKSSVYEGGFRVPFAMQYKGKIRNGTFHHPVSSMDIFATMADLTALPVNPEKPLDGVSLIPFVTGKNTGKPHETIYLRKFDQKQFAVRHGDHKLVTKENGAIKELYDLKNDTGENTNIIAVKPEIAEKIDMLRLEWNKKLIDPLFLGLNHLPSRQNRQNNPQNQK